MPWLRLRHNAYKIVHFYERLDPERGKLEDKNVFLVQYS